MILIPVLVTASVIVVGLVVYAYCIEPYHIQVTRTDILYPDLPESMDGLTICHLTDIHAVAPGGVGARLAKILSALDADICAVTGDMISGIRGLDAISMIFRDFRPRLGVYAVPGNGEYKTGIPIPTIAEGLSETGIRLLVNESIAVHTDGASIRIIGVDDPHRWRDDLNRAQADAGAEDFRLLLAHSPDILAKVQDDSAHLILAGHTHGGQIRLPFIGALWLHCHQPFGIASGYFGPEALSAIIGRSLSSTHLYVSRGLGGSGIRARFMCPPEVALLTLRRG